MHETAVGQLLLPQALEGIPVLVLHEKTASRIIVLLEDLQSNDFTQKFVFFTLM